jgi:hypothetical protein
MVKIYHINQERGFTMSVPLFDFAFHKPEWLADIANAAKEEPWGDNYKILETYLRANFEIAKSQNKIYESTDGDFAMWRIGTLLTAAADPIWLYYEKNLQRDKQPWRYKSVKTGHKPIAGVTAETLSVRYEPDDFNSQWDIHIEPRTIDHIMKTNSDRLTPIFGSTTSHRIFLTIYGEIMLEKKEAVGVLPQWYRGDYGFLLPLRLTTPEKVDLSAALSVDKTMKRYQLHTLLTVQYGYANARAVAKSRSQFMPWITDDELNDAVIEIED